MMKNRSTFESRACRVGGTLSRVARPVCSNPRKPQKNNSLPRATYLSASSAHRHAVRACHCATPFRVAHGTPCPTPGRKTDSGFIPSTDRPVRDAEPLRFTRRRKRTSHEILSKESDHRVRNGALFEGLQPQLVVVCKKRAFEETAKIFRFNYLRASAGHDNGHYVAFGQEAQHVR